MTLGMSVSNTGTKRYIIMTGCLNCSFYTVVSRYVKYSSYEWLISNFSRGVVNVTDSTMFYKVFCKDDMKAIAWTDTWFNGLRVCEKANNYINLATSEYNADMMRKAHIRVDDIVPRPVPDNFYSPYDVEKKSITFLAIGIDSPYPVDNVPPKHRLLTIGKMLDRKGIRQTLRVLNELKLLSESVIKTNVDVPFPHVVTKSGVWYGNTEYAMDRQMSDDDILALYRKAKFYLALSYAEGFGLPPWEAMSAGVPVIYIRAHAFKRLTGIPIEEYDVVELPGVTLYVPSDTAVKRAIDYALSLSKDEYDDLSAKSRQFAESARASVIARRLDDYVRNLFK